MHSLPTWCAFVWRGVKQDKDKRGPFSQRDYDKVRLAPCARRVAMHSIHTAMHSIHNSQHEDGNAQHTHGNAQHAHGNAQHAHRLYQGMFFLFLDVVLSRVVVLCQGLLFIHTASIKGCSSLSRVVVLYQGLLFIHTVSIRGCCSCVFLWILVCLDSCVFLWILVCLEPSLVCSNVLGSTVWV